MSKPLNASHHSEILYRTSDLSSLIPSNVLTETNTKTVTNKTFDSSTTLFQDETDITKKAKIRCNLLPTGQTTNFTLPNEGGAITLDENPTTLTNKTIQSALFSGTHTGTINHSGLIDSSNTTDSTSSTSDSAIKTDGGLSVAKNIYGLALYGQNKLTNHHVVMIENSTTQSISKATYTNVVFDTIVQNPSSMTTYISSGGADGFTLNQTGLWLITIHISVPITDVNPAHCRVFINRVGTDYDCVIAQTVTSYSGGLGTFGTALTYSALRYYNSGQRLGVYIEIVCTPSSALIGNQLAVLGDYGTKTSFSAQLMGS